MAINSFPIATVSAASFLTDAAAARDAAEAAALDAFTTGARKSGFGRHARNTLNTLAMWSDDYMGTNGIGGTDFFPRSITASQSGTTVTATTSVFRKLYVGARIVWDSGEEAIITDVNNSGSSYADITTCTVDRSQTVSSGAATIKAKHLVGISYGDSVGNRIAPVLQKLLYRSLGFGGYIINANGLDSSFGGQIARVDLAGGAADATNDSGFPDYPWGQWWTLPSAGTIIFSLQNDFAVGVERSLRHGLEPEERKHDTAVLVWKRGAGAFTVERKRFWDVAWEAVETVADASTGTANYNHLTWTHDLSSDWEYRVTGTSGTINILSFTFRNDTRPGYVHWPLSRGGELISDFDQLSSAELAELCQIHGQPDFRCVFAYDTIPGTTTSATYKTILEADRTLWQTAAPRTDHVWFEGWEAASDQAEQVAWNTAIKEVALENDDSLVPLYDLFGDFATSGSLKGWIEDSVHPSIKGEVIIGHMFLRSLGIADHPTIKEGRDVDSRRGDFASLYVLGDDIADRVRKVEARPYTLTRGAKWDYTNVGFLYGSTGGAIGTGDFTISFDLTVLATVPVQYFATVGTSGASFAQNGGLVVAQVTQGLFIYLRDASGNTIEYRYTRFAQIYGGRTGNLTIRSDVANDRFDLFWDGKPMPGLVGTVAGTTTSPLGTWSGTGTEFGIPQGSASDRASDFFSAMFWRERLTDAEIQAIAFAGAPQDTAPDFWWSFAEGRGRVTNDRSGNGRDGQWFRGNPNQYNVGTGPIWKHPAKGGLGKPWVGTLGAVTVLIPGDSLVAKYSATRDCLLPATPEVGDQVRVTKATSQTVRITQPALHQILTGAGTTVGTNATTIGTGGRIQFGGSYDSVTLLCTRAEAGVAYEWVVVDQTGAALTWT